MAMFTIPKRTRPTQTRRGWSGPLLGSLLIAAILCGIIAVGRNDTSSWDGPSKTPLSGCQADWRSCTTNLEVMNTWNGWSHVRGECKDAATAKAKYGDPKWPWFAFTSYLDSISFVKEGRALLVERDAQFQNGFGAMAHVQVLCSYDLAGEKVIDVGWSEKN